MSLSAAKTELLVEETDDAHLTRRVTAAAMCEQCSGIAVGFIFTGLFYSEGKNHITSNNTKCNLKQLIR